MAGEIYSYFLYRCLCRNVDSPGIQGRLSATCFFCIVLPLIFAMLKKNANFADG